MSGPHRATAQGPAEVAFVGGFGRSGSTLIELALGRLPEAVALGEVMFVWQRGVRENQSCGCGEPFGECPFWTAVGKEAFGGWDQLDLDAVLALKDAVDRNRHLPQLLRGRPAEAFVRQVGEYNDLVRRVYAGARAVSGRPMVIDSSKHVSFAATLSRAQGLDLRVVHVVRDPLGVANSWGKVVVRPEVAGGGHHMPVYSPARSSLLWDLHNSLYELLRHRLRVPVRQVRYEDFVAAPHPVLRDIAGFLGATPPPEWADPAARTVQLGMQHTVAGNPMRFTRGPVEVRRDDGWREGLDRRSRATVLTLTAPLRLRYGYGPGRRS